jgi:cell division septation protein DedD
MEEKNELNDLLLGEENKSGGGKKLFLIIAGALLVFFVTIGIMKFVNSGDDKVNTNATKVVKEAPKETNKTVDASTAPNDEKLNEIVRKLQEDAKTQQSGTPSTPLDAPGDKNVVAQKTAVVNVPIKKAEPTPTLAPVVTPKAEPMAAPVPKVQIPAVAESPKEVLKEAVKPIVPVAKAVQASKPTPKPQVQAKKEPVVQPVTTKAEPVQGGGYYIQVGYADSDKSAEPIKSKAVGVGYKVTTKQAQVKDKNVTKVFVGPFGTKEEAEKEKQKVREQIKNDAFVIKG